MTLEQPTKTSSPTSSTSSVGSGPQRNSRCTPHACARMRHEPFWVVRGFSRGPRKANDFAKTTPEKHRPRHGFRLTRFVDELLVRQPIPRQEQNMIKLRADGRNPRALGTNPRARSGDGRSPIGSLRAQFDCENPFDWAPNGHRPGRPRLTRAAMRAALLEAIRALPGCATKVAITRARAKRPRDVAREVLRDLEAEGLLQRKGRRAAALWYPVAEPRVRV